MKTPRFDKLLASWCKRNPLVAGELRCCSVEHDDRCRMYRGKGDCNCHPTFSYKELPWREGDFGTETVVLSPPASSN